MHNYQLFSLQWTTLLNGKNYILYKENIFFFDNIRVFWCLVRYFKYAKIICKENTPSLYFIFAQGAANNGAREEKTDYDL